MKQRRYRSAEQIENLIDRAHKRLDDIQVMISGAEMMLTESRRNSSDEFWRGDVYQAKIVKLKKRAERNRLHLLRLKDRLAEFNTMLLPNIGIEDRSVAA